MTTTSKKERTADVKTSLASDPLWYKDSIIYELHIKSFCDSDGDGIGDLRGLTSKLDYLQNLGITAIWLLPFYPSPLRDDGYDIADYHRVNPQYGTLRDFRLFLKEAHNRNIRVITELVINHTSDQHDWFQKSRRAKPGSYWRDFYVWSDTPDKFQDARIIFKDFESSNWAWDSVAKAYYWHRFYSHQPDLNFDNPEVFKALLRVMDFWFEMGVDGMRLDAVPYLFERDGTNCENLPETYELLERLRAHVDRKFRDKMLLAEANQWPEDAVAYFGNGNRCHMAFHFPIMPRLFMGSWMEDRFPIIDIFDQTPAIPASCQWAIFLRNHDELTLEMVSDEERDYMYRVFAKDPTARINLGIRRRLAPLLGNNRRKVELMNMLLLSLPGTPVIYYGDEIGMGDNHYLGDRNGVRTPMQWSADRNAGFSRSNPQKLFLPVIIDPDYHYEAVNVENQERNLSSLYWWTKRVIATRKRFKAFGRGSLEFLHSDNPKVLSFVREYEDEIILVVVNLSRFSQAVELDLSRYRGYVPEEVVSGNKFPPIKETPYFFTLGFYDYYWFSLQKEGPDEETGTPRALPEFTVAGRWQTVFQGKTKEKLERDVLPDYLARCRWFAGKAKVVQQLKIADTIVIDTEPSQVIILLLTVRYLEGGTETYQLPVSFAREGEQERLREFPQAEIAFLRSGTISGLLFDASYRDEFRKHLLSLVFRKQIVKGQNGQLTSTAGSFLRRMNVKALIESPSNVLKAEQSNTSMLFNNELMLKLYRRLDEGINPDLEIGQHLTEHVRFPNIPRFGGSIDYRRKGTEPVVLGIIQEFVKSQGDAWSFALTSAGGYFERVQERRLEMDKPPTIPGSMLSIGSSEIPGLMQELIGGIVLQSAELLGQRTAELHRALSSETDDPRFAPEPFSLLYQRSLYHSFRTMARRTFDLLRKQSASLEEDVRREVRGILGREKQILDLFAQLFSKKLRSMKIRIHGDYHLGQVLYTGSDFVIIDFEGEPARTISERRLKRSPLRDVAGMIRSFHYPTYSLLFTQKTRSPEESRYLEPWADLWYRSMSGVFLNSYLRTVGESAFVPQQPEELSMMLNAFLMAKAVYEVDYELNNRPSWVVIPIRGIANILEDSYG